MIKYEPDPVESSEIMELLGASFVDIDDPRRHQKLKDIIDHFSGVEDMRHQVLRILAHRPSTDPLETVWTWVQLIQERVQKIQDLNKEMFTEDIAKDIEGEYIIRDKITTLKEHIEGKIVEKKQKEESFEDGSEGSRLVETKNTLQEIESISEELSQY